MIAPVKSHYRSLFLVANKSMHVAQTSQLKNKHTKVRITYSDNLKPTKPMATGNAD